MDGEAKGNGVDMYIDIKFDESGVSFAPKRTRVLGPRP